MWTEHDDQMMSSIESALITLVDECQFDLEEMPGLDKKDRKNLVDEIKLHYSQIGWLSEIKQRLSDI